MFTLELDYKAIGDRIRRLRMDKNLSQEDLRYKANISKTHMSHIETGSTKLSLPVLVDIANALDTTTDYILRECVSSTAPVFIQEIEDIVSDCNVQELRAMVDTMNVVKKSMRRLLNNKSENQ